MRIGSTSPPRCFSLNVAGGWGEGVRGFIWLHDESVNLRICIVNGILGKEPIFLLRNSPLKKGKLVATNPFLLTATDILTSLWKLTRLGLRENYSFINKPFPTAYICKVDFFFHVN